MRIKDLLTKDRFTSWLKSQHQNRRFKVGCENHCVVAQYLHDNGYKNPSVDGVYCSYQVGSYKNNLDEVDTEYSKGYKLPRWVSSFIDKFDQNKVGSPKACLQILKEI